MILFDVCLFVLIIVRSSLSIHKLFIARETQTCYWDKITYSYKKYVGIFYMHYCLDMITHGTAFDAQVSSTGWGKLVTRAFLTHLISVSVEHIALHSSALWDWNVDMNSHCALCSVTIFSKTFNIRPILVF